MFNMYEENFKQQELFEQKKYISDLVEESTNKKKSSLVSHIFSVFYYPIFPLNIILIQRI